MANTTPKADDLIVQAAREAAKAEAAKIIADAMRDAEALRAAAGDSGHTKYLPANPEAFELVRVEIPLSKEKKAPLYVNVNDRNMLIERGKEVDVPRYIAEAIRESAAQDKATFRMIDKYATDSAQRLKTIRAI